MVALAVGTALLTIVLLASVDADAVQTGVALAVAVAIALGTTRFVGRWLMKSARAEFQDALTDAVRVELRAEHETQRAELAAHGAVIADELAEYRKAATEQLDTVSAQVGEIKQDVSWCKAELAERTEIAMMVERNTRWILALANAVGVVLEQ